MAAFMRKTAVLGKKFLLLDARVTFSVVSTLGVTVSLLSPRSFCSVVERPKIYQYLICPFCNRVKSYLDFCGIEYETIEVNPINKAEITFPVVTKKVPVAIINGEIVEDSSKIIQVITKHAQDTKLKNFPGKAFFTEDTAQWSDWSEKKLAVMLYPNITATLADSWETCAYAYDVAHWSPLQRMLVRTIGPVGMVFAHGKIKQKYGIVDERKELNAVLAVWCEAIRGKKFLHGDQVTMPDVLVFGVLKSIQGLRTFNEIMAENPELKAWYDNVSVLAPSRDVTKVVSKK